jgi:KipI family sensor histidine kinase inhibitor
MELRYVLSRGGDDLFSVSLGSTSDAQALAERLRRDGQWTEVVAGIDSVVVRFEPLVLDVDTARRSIEECMGEIGELLTVSADVLEIPVVYGDEFGPDLDELCQQTGMSKDEFVDLHTGRDYPVDMIGFTPGFAFVGGLDDRLRVPRREEPRQRVAAGSVGIADGRTGLYGIASPGGWTLVGRTPLRLFDPDAADPFLIRAGMRVRFKAVSADEFNQ